MCYKSDFNRYILAMISSCLTYSYIFQIAPEEFNATVWRINQILSKMVTLNFKWLLFGCLCCCCTLGCSVWPVVCLNKRTKRTLDKALDWENRQLYHKVSASKFLNMYCIKPIFFKYNCQSFWIYRFMWLGKYQNQHFSSWLEAGLAENIKLQLEPKLMLCFAAASLFKMHQSTIG